MSAEHFGITPKTFDFLMKTFGDFNQIDEVIIFGSRAMGNFKKGSDIDLAMKGNIDLDTIARLKTKLNDELPIPYLIDIVDYHSISNPALKEHIDKEGKKLFTA